MLCLWKTKCRRRLFNTSINLEKWLGCCACSWGSCFIHRGLHVALFSPLCSKDCHTTHVFQHIYVPQIYSATYVVYYTDLANNQHARNNYSLSLFFLRQSTSRFLSMIYFHSFVVFYSLLFTKWVLSCYWVLSDTVWILHVKERFPVLVLCHGDFSYYDSFLYLFFILQSPFLSAPFLSRRPSSLE